MERNGLPLETRETETRSLNGLNIRDKWALQREGGEVIREIIIAKTHEQGRALITSTIMENLGTLSALESHLTHMAPNGEERYRYIVDAYTAGAARKLAGW
jgi:hypothetical protein